jgi:tetratricopeptide (TPR) repeat protein
VSDNNNVGASMDTGGHYDRRPEPGEGSARAPAAANDHHRDLPASPFTTANPLGRHSASGDGVGVARLEAEGEIALARLALDAADPACAAAHVAAALGEDPTLPDAYEMLRILDAEPPRARDYFPLYDGVAPGGVAARSYLAARAGHFNEALDLLAIVAAMAPTKTWTAAGWLDLPGIAEQVEPATAAESLLSLALHLDEPVDPALLPVLAPYLEFGRRLVEAHDHRVDVLAPLSGLARRLGATDEAMQWCERAERTSPSARTAIMLGYAYRAAGRSDDMFAIWRTAIRREPTNVDIHVDLAEHLDRARRPAEALQWLDRAVAVDPTHHKALPAACELRYRTDRNVAHLIRLVDHWRVHPDHAYADDLLAKACDGGLWLRFVPPPTEMSCVVAREAERRPAGGWSDRASLGGDARRPRVEWEPPSARAAHAAAFPAADMRPTKVPFPDPRRRFASGSLDLWRYDGATAWPALSPPSAAAVASLRDVASVAWAHPVGAYGRAAGFAGLPLEDLLGLLVHVPAPAGDMWRAFGRTDPCYWPRFAQACVCLGLLHHRREEPWPTSTRRRVLVDIANGVEDWTTDAALFALVTAAWMDPLARGDVAAVVSLRYAGVRKAMRRRPVSIAISVASLVLMTPGIDEAVRLDARRFLGIDGRPSGMDGFGPPRSRRARFGRHRRRKE